MKVQFHTLRGREVVLDQERFNREYNEPVELSLAHEAISRFIYGKDCRMSVPAHPNDDDMILTRALRELSRYRKASEVNG
jgi:hypothetical protein